MNRSHWNFMLGLSQQQQSIGCSSCSPRSALRPAGTAADLRQIYRVCRSVDLPAVNIKATSTRNSDGTMITLLWWLLFCGPAEAADPPPGGYYTTRYDHLDVDNILNQKRLVHYYSACLLDRGTCTPQGLEFKRILPEAIKTNCLRCTEKQRVVVMRSIRRLKKQYPDVWAELAASWDPTGDYVQRLEESYNRIYPTRSAQESTLFGVRFGGIGGDDEPSTLEPANTGTLFTSSFPTTRLPLTTAVTTSTTTATSPATTTTTTTSSTTIRTTSSTTSRSTQRPATVTTSPGIKPFSSIGVNLVVPNPVKLLDAITNTVKFKTGMFLDTVNYVLRG